MKKTVISLAVAVAIFAVYFGLIAQGSVTTARAEIGDSVLNMQQHYKTEAEVEALSSLPGLR